MVNNHTHRHTSYMHMHMCTHTHTHTHTHILFFNIIIIILFSDIIMENEPFGVELSIIIIITIINIIHVNLKELSNFIITVVWRL